MALSIRYPKLLGGPQVITDAEGHPISQAYLLEFERAGATFLVMHPQISMQIAMLDPAEFSSSPFPTTGRLAVVECLHIPPTIILAFSPTKKLLGVLFNFVSESNNNS